MGEYQDESGQPIGFAAKNCRLKIYNPELHNIDRDCPGIRSAYQQWLDQDNFDEQVRQGRSLSDFMSTIE